MSQLPEIIRTIDRVSADVVAKASTFQAAILSDVAGRRGTMHGRVAPVHQNMKVAGPAFTVEVRPGDNLMIHKALDMAGPGDVVVVDGGGDLTNALFGELMLTYAISRGIAGIVLNGAVRDIDVISASAFPVYAAGVTHRGPYKDGPGEINVPIAIDGMVVHPGDLVLGDADGVLCVPLEGAATILAAAQAKVADEQKTRANMAAGTHDTSWVDATLRRIGCDPQPR